MFNHCESIELIGESCPCHCINDWHLFTELCPRCAAYYGNRAATYMMMSKYDKALEDARLALQIDPEFVKVN